MKRVALILIGIATFALGACSSESSDSLSDGRTGAPTQPAGGSGTAFDHAGSTSTPGTDSPPTNGGPARVVGSPEITSRLHACGKMSVASLGNILTSRGLTGGGARPPNTASGQDLYMDQATPATLGGANYVGRTSEAPLASTSAMSKMFDIFTMASYDGVASGWTAPACPGVKLLGADGKFTKDGLSCLMGKPARDEHLLIANDAIVKNPTDGAKLAITALLSAAHTCQ